ncbi:hypothetical protein [Mycobacteroides abscessus]|uniref:hypothetical protein n=1 Tax=Mycobacteroides abscessus TaxID=36809 RepID=UPI001603E329|nr:hypothetical protein [Mycobacteroides abscessus]
MPPLLSAALTTDQVIDRSKDVTRRLNWLHISVGTPLTVCTKVQGRKAGEPLIRLAEVVVVSLRREALGAITSEDCVREGFPHYEPAQFVEFFCRHMRGCTPQTLITRIEWLYVPGQARSVRFGHNSTGWARIHEGLGHDHHALAQDLAHNLGDYQRRGRRLAVVEHRGDPDHPEGSTCAYWARKASR